MQTPPPFKVSISSLFSFFFFFLLSFFFSLSRFLSPLPLFLTSSMISKRCKSIWNLVMKHTHKNADGGSLELLLIFLLKVQKKVIKISKPKEKKKQKRRRKWGGNEAKNIYPSIFLPISFYFFSLYCQERHGMDSSSREKKKKRLRKILTSYPFSLLLFLLSSGVGTGDVTQRPAAKSSSAKLSLCKYRLGNTGGAGERNRPGKRNNPPPHPERTMPREQRCSPPPPPPPPSPPCCVSCLVGAGAA